MLDIGGDGKLGTKLPQEAQFFVTALTIEPQLGQIVSSNGQKPPQAERTLKS